MTDEALPVRHLSKAPIAEAIVDFRTKLPETFKAEEFNSLRDVLANAFPRVEEQRGFEALFEINLRQPPAAPKTRDHGLSGLLFRTADALEVAQFRLDGFTFNRLRPYTSWKAVQRTAVDMWNRYLNVARPAQVTRVALRYINRVPLPPHALDLNQVLRLKLDLPAELPQTVTGFLARVLLFDESSGASISVTQSIEASLDSNQRTLILDIDAFRTGDWNPASPEVLDALEGLHELKNRVFFASLTPSILEQFE